MCQIFGLFLLNMAGCPTGTNSHWRRLIMTSMVVAQPTNKICRFIFGRCWTRKYYSFCLLGLVIADGVRGWGGIADATKLPTRAKMVRPNGFWLGDHHHIIIITLIVLYTEGARIIYKIQIGCTKSTPCVGCRLTDLVFLWVFLFFVGAKMRPNTKAKRRCWKCQIGYCECQQICSYVKVTDDNDTLLYSAVYVRCTFSFWCEHLFAYKYNSYDSCTMKWNGLSIRMLYNFSSLFEHVFSYCTTEQRQSVPFLRVCYVACIAVIYFSLFFSSCVCVRAKTLWILIRRYTYCTYCDRGDVRNKFVYFTLRRRCYFLSFAPNSYSAPVNLYAFVYNEKWNVGRIYLLNEQKKRNDCPSFRHITAMWLFMYIPIRKGSTNLKPYFVVRSVALPFRICFAVFPSATRNYLQFN